MYSKFDALKDKYKHLDPTALAGYNLLSQGRNSGWECPHCGNGSGKDGTGVTWKLLNDGYKGYCFRCDKYFDVFDLIAKKYNFNAATEFRDVIEQAQRIFGDAPKPVKPQKKVEAKVEDFNALIQASWKKLDLFFADKKTWRGLLKATLVVFGCGYLPDWNYFGSKSARIIIPTSINHYLARYVGTKEIDKKFWKIHRGTKDLFGEKKVLAMLEEKPDLLVFVVEGEIDAMSIYQSGFAAVALGGSSVSDHQLNIFRHFPEGTKFILMLDNDETGRKKSVTVAEKIRKLGFFVHIDFLDAQFADANDWLVNNDSGLKRELLRISDAAMNPPATENNLPAGIKKSAVEGINEITSDYKPPAKSSNPAEESADDDDGIERLTKMQITSCPIDLTVPKKFVFKPKGIYHKEKSKDKESKGEEIEIQDSATPIVPLRILQKKDRSDKQVELAYYERSTHKWHKFTVPATTIAKAQNITDLASFGVDINSTHARSISEFLTKIQYEGDNARIIPQAVHYDQPGWTDRDCTNFIYPPEGKIDGEEYVLKDNGFNYEEKFSSAGTKEEWYVLFAATYSPMENAWARYALGLVLAAPLVKICNTRNWQGVLVSPSGSGKSAVAKLAFSIFGNPEKIHTTFNGTNNFSDALAARLNDLPCWIDEFQSADKKTREDFQNFIYNYAEQKTRGRLNKNSEMKQQFEFSGTRLCTSEQTVLQENFMQGAFNRVIQIQGFKPLKDGIGRELHENLPYHYGHYGRQWIRYCSAHRQEIRETYEAVRVKYRSWNFVPHHLQNFALAYTALEFFYRMLKEDRTKAIEAGIEEAIWINYPSPLEMLDHVGKINDKKVGDIDFFRELLPTPQEANNFFRAFDFLSETRFSQKSRFYHQTREGWASPDSKGREGALGYFFQNGDVGFLPGPLNRYLAENGFPPAKDLMRGFFEKELIKVSGGDLAKRFQYSAKIYNDPETKSSVKLYLFPKKSFDAPDDQT